MTILTLKNSGGTADTDNNSSIFYDYNSDDTAFVGDDSGFLHKITPFFKNVPTAVRTGGWPVQVNATAPTALTSPVHDILTGDTFVSDAGGFLYRVSSTTTVTRSGQLDFSVADDSGPGIVQGPVVDPTSNSAYVFATSDGTTNCASAACSAIYQLSMSFTSGSTGTEAAIGASTASGTIPAPLYIGTFDNAYENSSNATGNLYVCGATGDTPTLYRVPLAAGVLGTPLPVAALTPAGTRPTCSPVTDVYNPNATGGAAEWLFFSVQNNGYPTLCANKGCALSFVDMPWQPSTSYQVGQEILVLSTADSTFYINVVTAGGTSGLTEPTWPVAIGTSSTDGSVTWLNQGPTTAAPLADWTANNAYTGRTRIVDSNGNVEIVKVGGMSGGTAPTWATTAGGTTSDGGSSGVTWVNAGVLPIAALPAAGGTSGIIFDNIVGAGTLAGASQVYFSTLSDQVCATSGGTAGGCAMQASQSQLK
jgi:hypothetical protein